MFRFGRVSVITNAARTDENVSVTRFSLFNNFAEMRKAESKIDENERTRCCIDLGPVG